MRNYLILILLFGAQLGCTQVVPNRVDVVNSGTATIEVTASLRIIDQLTVLCEQQMAPIAFPTSAERGKAVADCVFEHLETLGGSTSALADFANQYCAENANLETLNPSQIAAIENTCASLGQL